MKLSRIFQSLGAIGLVLAASAHADAVRMTGAGATFPYPIYSKWFSEFNKIDPSVEINYQSIGSGGGIRQLLDKTIDFGASDAPMTDKQLAKANPTIIHVPTVLGAVVITYNLPMLKEPLKLTGEQIADIFLGKIKTWNDPGLLKLNPGLSAVKKTWIMVAYRSDGSGTTNVFADYLAKVSPEWKQKVGVGTALQWPVGLGGKGNEGVTGLVKQTVGTIGYTELSYAASLHLPVAELRNKSGAFVAPTAKAVTAAAKSSVKTIPKDFRVSITDASGKEAYSISSFTYLLVYQMMDSKKGPKFIEFLNWALTDGQKMAEPLTYAPLPKELVTKIKARLKDIKTHP
jgi:phosphate transport system substrate-binding protein